MFDTLPISNTTLGPHQHTSTPAASQIPWYREYDDRRIAIVRRSPGLALRVSWCIVVVGVALAYGGMRTGVAAAAACRVLPPPRLP